MVDDQKKGTDMSGLDDKIHAARLQLAITISFNFLLI